MTTLTSVGCVAWLQDVRPGFAGLSSDTGLAVIAAARAAGMDVTLLEVAQLPLMMTYDHFIPTGLGAHGIYPSRDATGLHVSNHDEGSLSVLDAALTASPWFW